MPPTIKDFARTAPKAIQALRDLGQAVEDAGLDPALIELVKLRASQLNACAYCLQYHFDLARKLGVQQRKLDQLAGWRDSPLFSPDERVALAWTERLTLPGPPPDEAERAALRGTFSEAEAAHLSVAVGLINAWNRINAGLGTLPPEAP